MAKADPTSPLDLRYITEALTTSYIGRNLVYYTSVRSTNDEAKMLAQQGAPEGTVVVAEVQTAGRGRLGREWLSPSHVNLLLSLIFRPPLAPIQAQRLTMICSLAVADAIHDVAQIEAQIKWPNDLLLAGRKAGGILTELGLRGTLLDYVVVGLGLNVNLRKEQLPPELRLTATSVAEVLGRPIRREALLCTLLGQLERRYERLKAGEMPVSEWASRLATLGRWVRVSDAEGAVEGQADAVDEDGALLLRLKDGSQRRILIGDVTLRQ